MLAPDMGVEYTLTAFASQLLPTQAKEWCRGSIWGSAKMTLIDRPGALSKEAIESSLEPCSALRSGTCMIE